MTSAQDWVDDAEDGAAPELSGLLAAAVGGDRRAVNRLLEVLHPLVLRYCRGRLGRQDTVLGSADDVAQEVCVAVVHALPTYRLRGLSFRAFVYGIAAHKVADAFRAAGRNRSDPVADLPDTPVPGAGPEERVLDAELVRRLDGLLHVLAPRQREVLVLRYWSDLSEVEIAAALGISRGTVKSTASRALDALELALTRQENPDG